MNFTETFTTIPTRWLVRPGWRSVGYATVMLGGLACGIRTASFAVDVPVQTVAHSIDSLQGVWPAEVPEGLKEDAFIFDGPGETNWQAYGQEMRADVAAFYATASQDGAAQRQALAKLNAHRRVIARALADDRYRVLHEKLAGLGEALGKRLDLIQAIFDTMELNPETARQSSLTRTTAQVLQAIQGLERDLAPIPNGTLWLPYLRADQLRAHLQRGEHDATVVALAETARARIAGRSQLEQLDQRAFLSRPAFLDYEYALDSFVAAANQPPIAEALPALKLELQRLIDALEQYETSSGKAAAEQARQAFAKVRTLTVDGGELISAALRKHWFNYNVRILASEGFLGKLVEDTQKEAGAVSDFVLGATVSGSQVTDAKVHLDLLPSDATMSFEIVVDGQIHSDTVARTPDATVTSQGNHIFRARKGVEFDGINFRTRPATIQATAHNTPTGVATRFSGGLFGRFADRIAWRKVMESNPEGEAIAASRIRERVVPRLDQEIDTRFNQAGKDLEEGVFQGLRKTGLFPDVYWYQTSDNQLKVSARLMGVGELAGAKPEAVLASAEGATLIVHESALNNATDRLNLAGRKLSNDQLREELEKFLSDAFHREFKFPNAANGVKPAGRQTEEGEDAGGSSHLYVFDQQDPIRFTIDRGQLTIALRIGLEYPPEDMRESIGTHEVRIPLSFTVDGNKVHMIRGSVGVSPLGGSTLKAGVMRSVIGRAIDKDSTVDAVFKLQGIREYEARITKLSLVDGWAMVLIE